MKLPNKGFTLLEILVALFIFVIMAMLATTGLYNVFRNKEILTQLDEKTTVLQLSLAIVNNDLQQIIDRPIMDNDTLQMALFGTQTTINFTRNGNVNPKSQAQRSHLQRVQYHYNNHQLIRNFWSVLDRAPDSTMHSRVLFDDITHFEIHYFDIKQRSYTKWPPKFLSNQTHKTKQPFPVAIELELTSTTWGKINLFYNIQARSLYAKQLEPHNEF